MATRTATSAEAHWLPILQPAAELVERAGSAAEGLRSRCSTSADPRLARAAGFRKLRFVRQVIDRFECRSGGIVLSSEPTTVGPEHAADFVGQVLARADRTLPLIAVSLDDRNQTAFDPRALQRDLAGLALVAVWGSAASRRIASLLSNQYACYGGAVRVDRPILSRADSPSRHRYVLRSRALQTQFAQEIRHFAASVNRELPSDGRCADGVIVVPAKSGTSFPARAS